MPTAPLHAALAYLRGLAAPAGGAGGDDAELLGRFAERRDEAAFAELLRRHGPAVLGVCRRVLADDADAEDAFQATFVILARRAGEVARRKTVGGFLYGVAVRTALRARSAREKRRARERQVAAMPETAAVPEKLWDELRPVLDEELAALPARYREPLRLCYLEGRTYDEAALALGCAKGTIASRVARGRERLRARLAARGVAPSAAVLAAGLAAQTSTSAVPPHLPAAALRAAALARAGAAGLAALAPRVRELAEGAAREAVRARLRVVGVLLLAACAAGLAGVAILRDRPDPGQETAAVAEAPAARAATWQMAARLGGSKGQVRYARFSPDGRTLADVSTDGVLRLWDTATWQERGVYEFRNARLSTVSLRPLFAPDSRHLSIGVTRDDSEHPGQPVEQVAVLESAAGREVARLSGSYGLFLRDASSLVTLRDGNMLTFWDRHTYQKRFEVKAVPEFPRCSLAHTEDGNLLFLWAHGLDQTCLLETADGRVRGRPEGRFAAFSGDGKSLATYLPGGVIKVWDTATGRERVALRGFNSAIVDGRFSPDGQLVLTSAGPPPPSSVKEDGSIAIRNWDSPYPLDIRLWVARTGAERARLSGRSRGLESARFSPEGRTVVYSRLQSGEDERNELVLWDVAGRKERAVLRNPGDTHGASFSADGRFLFTNDAGRGNIKVRDPSTGNCLHDLPGPYWAGNLEFSPDGTMLVAMLRKTSPVAGWELLVFRLSDQPLPPPVDRGSTSSPPAQPRATRNSARLGAAGVPAAPNKHTAATIEPAPTEAAKALATLAKEREAAAREFSDGLRQAGNDTERKSLQRRYAEGEAALTARALQIAREHPTDPAATKALQFVLQRAPGVSENALGRVRAEALAQIRKDYLASRHLAELQLLFVGLDTDTVNGLLTTLAVSSPYPVDRCQAALRLADTLAVKADNIRRMPAASDPVRGRNTGQGSEGDPLGQPDADALERDAARWYTLVLEKYGAVPSPGQGPTLRESAERGLFALQHLGIGKAAPELVGEDLDGKPFKLSDYRGNVVVLVFCADWTGSWRPWNARKRRLVERLTGKPFALLEVNSDHDRQAVKRMTQEEGVTWRCWFDKGRPGPISLRWNVQVWPAVYLLDGSGVIRHKGSLDKTLDAAVDGLLREMSGSRVGRAGP